MDEQQIRLAFNEKIRQMKKTQRRKSYTRPRLSSIDELHSTNTVQDPYRILQSNCNSCGCENAHVMKQFICKNCKAMNF
jgi:hypothetical protein